jgi:hypothetical protein
MKQKDHLNGGNMKLLSAVITFLVMTSSYAVAGEDCGMMGGKCRELCKPDEEIVQGAYLDCSEKQECCVPKPEQKEQENKREGADKWKNR